MALFHILVVAIFLHCFAVTEGYPEIGFLAKLPADIARKTTGWGKLSGWVTSLTDVKGLYNFDADLSRTGDIHIPITGIYFVSVTLPINNAEQGLFQAGLVINDVTTDKSIGLVCRIENMTTGVQMLSFAGFINLRAGENASIYAYSEIDTSWVIKLQSSLTFHFYGRYGSTPAFLATPRNPTVMWKPQNTLLHRWRTTGRAGVFQSLSGLTRSRGKFTTVCTGVHILTANIIVEGGAGEYSVSTIFNAKKSVSGVSYMNRNGQTTINVYQAFSLPKGSSIDLTFSANSGLVRVLEESTWSMAYVGETSSNTREFASFLTSTVSGNGGSWKELPGLLRNGMTQTASGSDSGQFLQPSNLILINTMNFAITDQANLYYAFVHLVFSGNATTIEAMTAVSTDKNTAVGKEGIFGTITKTNQNMATISLSGIFHIRKQEHLSVFIKSKSPDDNFFVHNSSFISFVRMRYAVSAFSARIQTKLTIQNSGWNELTGPWLTETHGLFSYGRDFSSATGKFTASHSGIYVVTGNIQINRADDSEIGLVVVKNNKIDLNNGLYAVNGEPSTRTTLNVYGSVNVKTGDQLSLYAYKSSSSDWEIDIGSGFSISYIGPSWAAYGFHAVLSNDKVITSFGNFPIDFWTVAKRNTEMTYMSNVGFGDSSYTSPIDGVFIVSANILLRNISISRMASGAGTFNLEGYVNGIQSTSIGLSDMKPTLADNSRDYYTLSFSSAVRIQKGQSLSLYLSSQADSSYVISKQSGFSVVLLSEYLSSHNKGLLGSKNVVAFLSSPNVWTGVVDISTSTSIPGRFVAGTGLVTTPTIHYSVPEPGIYYVTGNFRLDNAGDGSLFEVNAEIDAAAVTGLYAVESSPKGSSYNLNFAGFLYLTFGQQIKIMVKTTKSSFYIGAGTSFSILKVQPDQHFPGLVVDKAQLSFRSNNKLTDWEETTKPGLLTSNIGYNAITGSYIPPVSGVYIYSINNYLKNSTNTETTSISLMDTSNHGHAYSSYGNNRTMLATLALYLSSNKTFNYLLNSSVPQLYNMDAGLSLYFIKTVDLITGFSAILPNEFTVLSAAKWTTITDWTTSSPFGFTSTSNTQIDAYNTSESGAYFISFSPLFIHSEPAAVKVAVSINSSTFLLAFSSYATPNDKLTVSVSGTLKLNIGDIVTFQVYSSVSGLKLAVGSSCSLIFLEGITTHTEGVAAAKRTSESISGSLPVQLSGFSSAKTGGYLARNSTVDASGVLINFHAGTFHYTANIIIRNKNSKSSEFRLSTVINGEAESPFSLQSVQSIEPSKEETLSFSSSMFLPRFSRVATLISTNDAFASYDILEGSSYTLILIDDNTGPVICEDQGLNLERLVPDYIRIGTEKSVTFTCTMIGQVPAQFSWLRNGALIPGHTSSTYTIHSTKLSDSADYVCKATYQSLTTITGNATLSVYDPTPDITALTYAVSVTENSPVSIAILQTFTVSASKFAVNQKATVAAYITDGDPWEDFEMSNASKTTIIISTKNPLDYEKRDFYTLSITAVNTEEKEAKNTTILFNVTVIDLNDNAPNFNPSIIRADVPEDLAVGNPIVTMKAIDPDSDSFAIVSHSIIGNVSRCIFAINSTTGEITLKRALDREKEDSYLIIVEARDQNFASLAEVILNVTDVNDNRPKFKSATYALSIVENMPIGSSIVQMFGADSDLGLNASLSFSIAAGNQDGYFNIDSTSGIIVLRKALNYEKNTSFVLRIGLNDRGSPPLHSDVDAIVTIGIVDVNDNFPRFEKSLYTERVSENIHISTSILQVRTTDKDGTKENSNLTFSINQILASKYFQVDKHSGVLSTAAKLDYESVNEFHFSIIASDNAAVPYTRHTNVIIYVENANDELPYFSPLIFNVTLSEYARPGALVVRLLGFDNDTSSALEYSIMSQSPYPHFGILPRAGLLLVQHELDRENTTVYNVTIGLSDGVNSAATPATVMIYISDENDNKPMFSTSKYSTSIYENATVGTFVLTVHARDADINSNAALTYSSMENTGLNISSHFFTINPSTGEITLAKPLNFEVQRVHSFVVMATDGGAVSLSSHVSVEVIVLDINDNAPYFSQQVYAAVIPESISIGSIVTVIQADDNDASPTRLSYEIVDGDSNNHFQFMPNLPNVIMTAAMLDYETTQHYELKLSVFDGMFYSPITATLQINVTDVNDENPVFNSTHYRVIIPENIDTSKVILQLLATDGDGTPANNRITYSSLESTADFSLHRTTGEINAVNVDYERQKQYSLVVIASDSGIPPRKAYAMIDILITDSNDNAPIVFPLVYAVNVSEAAMIGAELVLVNATDADSGINGEIVYSITDGNNASLFNVKESTGMITLNSMLNHEGAAKIYTLTVIIKDRGGLQAANNATVIIHVMDINYGQLIFDVSQYTRTIPEDVPVGSSLVHVHASDKHDASVSSNIIYYLVSGGTSGNFSINATTGVISSLKSFDYEDLTHYVFQVEARDTVRNKLRGRTLVVINIADINDNRPMTDKSFYNVSVSAETNVGSQIVTIFASDNDVGLNSQLQFSFITGNSDGLFTINSNGVIYLVKVLSSITPMQYSLTVMIQDRGIPSLNTNVTVLINVVFKRKSMLAFSESHYFFTVNETARNEKIGKIVAYDKDNATSKHLSYSIVATRNGVQKIFYLDQNTGEVYVNSSTNFEIRSQYDISARATNERGVYASTVITINIIDVNESPYFIHTINGEYVFNISESVYPYTYVHSVFAKDNDTGSNGQLTYSLMLQPGSQSAFNIDQQGRIYTKTILDFESARQHSFQVQAEDNGLPKLSALINVTILVLDYNDNYPEFVSPTPHNITVHENPLSGTQVGILNATDADSTTNGHIQYIAVYPTGILTVDQSTGILTIGDLLYFDYEKSQSYELIAVARDLGIPHLTSTKEIHLTIVNTNDNSPYFTAASYNISVYEVTPVGTLIMPLDAVDNDLGLPGIIKSYKTVAGDTGTFHIDETGKIYLTNKLSFTMMSVYHLVVNATDSGMPERHGQADVYINVLELSRLQPTFLLRTHYKTVKENNIINQDIIQVNATSIEDIRGPFIYSINPNNDSKYFSIDNTTGIIRNLISFDYEKKNMYTFTVQVLDAHNQKTDTSHIIIYVDDINDNAPKFTSTAQFINVSEASTPGTLITSLSATDSDSTTNSKLQFIAISGNGMDKFTVERDGRIFLRSSVDSKVRDHYALTIKVEDMGSPALHSNITLMINVQTANLVHLSQPIFNQSYYVKHVDEDVILTPMMFVYVTNQAISSAIFYKLIGPSHETDPFTISPSGAINLIVKLDYLTKNTYSFQVEALNSEGRRAHATVAVYVHDVNNRRPYFMPSSYDADIFENSPVGMDAVQLMIKDADTPSLNAPYTFKIVKGNADGKFNISNTGIIRLANIIDLEQMNGTSYNLTISVQEGNSSTISKAKVVIRVKDVNDNPPIFQQIFYVFNVSEDALPGFLINTIVARDADRSSQNKMIQFSLISGTDFSLSTDGNLTVKNELDYEKKREYELIVLAADSGKPSLKETAIIKINILDVNDQMPYFKQTYYNNTVSEAFPVGGTVLTVAAYDDDAGLGGILQFSLTDPASMFMIDSSGRIVLLRKLNYEENRNYTLFVNVTDSGGNVAAQLCTVFIKVTDINDNQPSFSLGYYTFRVLESAKIGSFVGHVVATDGDYMNNAISYSILRNEHSGKFAIHDNGSISLASSLDYEKIKEYRFVVRATDQGTPAQYDQTAVNIMVEDVNDNYPVPSKNSYHLNVTEKTIPGTQILVILCTDKDSGQNGHLSYTKTAGDPTGSFYLNNKGILYVMKQLDSFTKSSYNMNVTISDNGIPQKSIHIMINVRVLAIIANQIRFEKNQYVFNVTENVIAGPFGPLKTVDVGNYTSKTIVYDVITNQAVINGILYISKSSGLIHMSRSIDHEYRRQIDFQVRAINDRGLMCYTHVTFIIHNANEMAFFVNAVNGTYQFNISESVPLYSFVGHISVQDDDTRTRNSFSYSLLPASTSSLLTIDHIGRIYTNSRLDSELNQTISFKVQIQDIIGTATADVILFVLDYNDKHPSFKQSVYNLSVCEDVKVGHTIYNFIATDEDQSASNNQIKFSLNTNQVDFSVSSDGRLRVNRRLNYSQKSKYEFTILAIDNGNPALTGNAIVVINVIDVNDNAPIFPSHCNNSISKYSPIGMVVIICSAIDKDTVGSLSYSISGSNSFKVDNTGVITLGESLDGTDSAFNLTLNVTDGIHVTSTIVRVNVTAIVICRPIFNQSLYIGYIKEDCHIQTSVLAVFASDSKNNSLSYSIEPGIVDFTIDSRGVIKTNRLLDYNVKSMYVFRVFARRGSFVAESVVVIHLVDVNNKLPIPGRLKYTVHVSEKAAIGAIVIGLNATDQDLHTRLTYSISSGNTLGSFRIDNSGRVLVNRALDYELLPTYSLIVSVSDGVHVTPVEVFIHVLDVDEPTTCGPCLACPPVSTFDFSQPAFVAAVSEKTAVGSVLAKVELNHAAKSNLIIANFSIKDAIARTYFTIHQTTGDVTLSRRLDAATLLQLKKFTFTVYNQFKCRTAAVQIILNNMFTGCPIEFTQQNHVVNVEENFPINQEFLTLRTKQFSESTIYSIVENSGEAMFSINASTGAIRLVTKLDYEKKTWHHFTVMANMTNLLSYTTVIVSVQDVNDNCPQISTISGTYYQPVQQGTIIGFVMVNDSDSFKNYTYTISSGNINQNFTIDENGFIRAKTVLKSDFINVFNIAITVNDSVCTATESVVIVVMKDNAPPCPSPSSCYNYTCAPCPTTQPLTKCPDKFCPGCPVCPTTSAPCPTTAMTTSCPIKTCPKCPITCPATVTCPVCPTLHCPSCLSFLSYLFKQAYYSINLYENQTVPSIVTAVHINGDFRASYSIVKAIALSMFSIDSETGTISLISQLNYTKQSTHLLRVRATIDGAYSETVVVVNVLDVNNNCPVFKQGQVDAELTSPVENGTLITWNRAVDADVNTSLTYSIVDGDDEDEFLIDFMGIVRTKNRVQLSQTKIFNLKINVTDGCCSAQSLAVVTIRTYNSSWIYSQAESCQRYMFTTANYMKSIPENTTLLETILTVHVNWSVASNYAIVEKSARQQFTINNETGQITLAKMLDYEKRLKYNFTVKASNAAGLETLATVTIFVLNINDNEPYFINHAYFATINEYTLSGTHITQVLSTDLDNPESVRMTIVSGNTNELFFLNSSNGEVALKKQPYLYTENTYILMIALRDTGGRQSEKHATVTLHIERITERKVGCSFFGNKSFVLRNLSENIAVGTVVAAITGTPVASNRYLRIAIENMDAINYFTYNSTTGEIRLKHSLDYEKKTSHVIFVSSQDSVTNITSTLFIYINVTNVDEHPLTFSSAPTSVTLSKLSSIGTYVGQVRATDADSDAKVSHVITKGNDGSFVINAETGVILLQNNISHSVTTAYMLTICATDVTSTSHVCHNITINIKNENNNNIVFGKPFYIAAVPLISTAGTIVTTVNANNSDGFGPICFSIDGTISNEYFSVNSSGVVTLKKSLSGSGFESPYVLIVCAENKSNQPSKNCVPVIIETGLSVMMRQNNHDPYFIHSSFNAVINENATIGTTVLSFIAGDNDTGLAGLVRYNELQGVGHEYFKVDQLSGEVTTLKTLNRNTTPKAFFLTADVSDHGITMRHSSKVNVTIAVRNPSFINNTITTVSSLTMDVILSKEPFIDSKIIKYHVIAQEYDPTITNFNDFTAMHPVSWYFVNFIPTTYHYRRFIVGEIIPSTSARRKRREVLDTTQASHIVFRVGNEAGCDKKSLENDICNGPLMPGRSYRYQLVGYYADNYPVTGAFTSPMATSVTSSAFATNVVNSSYIATYWIIGLVMLSLMFFIAVLVIVVILCYKKRYRVYVEERKNFTNPLYRDQMQKSPDGKEDDINFYASDKKDVYGGVEILKNQQASSHLVAAEGKSFNICSNNRISQHDKSNDNSRNTHKTSYKTNVIRSYRNYT